MLAEIYVRVKKKLLHMMYATASDAAGRTRTGTAVNRLILSQVRLPIPPQRHEKRFAKTDLYNIISADKKQAFYFGMEK